LLTTYSLNSIYTAIFNDYSIYTAIFNFKKIKNLDKILDKMSNVRQRKNKILDNTIVGVLTTYYVED